ncbi:MAG: chemotaxis protein CheB [Desulfobulbaceae bacterium]|uniref:protein-glutamate methylesterase n=1 Tax=Candidatus Desulfatifera sulfidica TaxID=2841691 RepID=A0A8J6N8L5_9BACT|nr:chemotaxis protein CheB [Candidatus Desulfatifera sulfidica]
MEKCQERQHRIRAVVIGASAGGAKALSEIFSRLSSDFPAAILVVNHLHPHSKTMQMVDYLGHRCKLRMKAADDKETIKPGTIYLAPANYHLLVEADLSLSLTIDEKVNFSRPSIDVLFETAAEAYQDELIGIVLTGGSKDGAAGLKKISDFGGRVIVQDPKTAEAVIMPQSALRECEDAQVMSLARIGDFLRDAVQVEPLAP